MTKFSDYLSPVGALTNNDTICGYSCDHNRFWALTVTHLTHCHILIPIYTTFDPDQPAFCGDKNAQ